MSRRVLGRLAAQAAISAVLIALALRVMDLDALRDALAGAEWQWLPVALPLFTLAKYVDSWRWRYLLSGIRDRPPQPALFGAFLIGNFVNNVMPLRMGDIAKIQVLANRYGASRAALAASVFLVEATLDGVVFILVVLFAIVFWDLEDVQGITAQFIAGIGVIAVVAFAVALWLARSRRLPLPRRISDRVEAGEANVRSGLHALRSWPRALVAGGLSLPAWAIEAAMFAAIGNWVFGLDLSYATYFTAMIAANVAVAVPIGLWNIGPYEALVTATLALSGVDTTVALTYATAVHLATNLWINATGLLTLWVMGITPRQVFAIRNAQPAITLEART